MTRTVVPLQSILLAVFTLVYSALLLLAMFNPDRRTYERLLAVALGTGMVGMLYESSLRQHGLYFPLALVMVVAFGLFLLLYSVRRYKGYTRGH